MNNVVNIDDYRPHWFSEAVCEHCDKEWLAVWPVAALILECPRCGLDSGQEKK